MASLLGAVSLELQGILAEVRAKTADGKLSVGEAVAVIVDAANRFVKVASIYSGQTGEEKKAEVVAACLQLFDLIVPYVKIPYLSAVNVPSFVRNYVIAQVRASLPATLSILIDKLYAALKPLLNRQPPQPSVN